MTGKNKCKILKDIRRQIAQENDIALVTSECKYQGDCAGTCPKCEAEVRYLEQELRKRQRAGKAIAVAGIAAALVVSTSGCVASQTGGDPLPDPKTSYTTQTVPETEWMGVPMQPEDTGDIPDPTGEPLMGDLIPTEDIVDGEIAGE